MPTIRESPRAQLSPDKGSAQWPPRSPFQALLSSPSGRKRWQDGDRSRNREVSPSPVKKTGGSMAEADFEEEDEDEDEDEETLELKLKALETKLKLRKLRNAKKGLNGGDEGSTRTTMSSRAESFSPRKSPRSTSSGSRSRLHGRDGGGEVEVPLSPAQDRTKAEEPRQTSPARARLGLNPGRLRAQEVSLKRARDGTQLPRRHAGSRALRYTGQEGGLSNELSQPRPPTSFGERLARSKIDAQERKAKDERIEGMRAKGFQMREYVRPKADTRKELFTFVQPPSGRQLEAMKSRGGGGGGGAVGRDASSRGSKAGRGDRPLSLNGLFSSRRPQAQSKNEDARSPDEDTDSSLSVQDEAQPNEHHQDKDEANPSYYDPFSELHLSKRHIPHPTIAREMSDKEIYTLPRLLKEVKAPDYDPPDCEADFVVFAILASKSQPYDQKAAHRTSDENKPQEDAAGPRGKFMVLHLCDLKWELDLFLFGTAFDEFWKLTPGTLLAILNPGIMPPKKTNENSGRFCLKLGSSEDSILEVGVARDLAWCESVRKDGKECGSWVDRRKTGICGFHLEMAVEREGRSGRMEVNTMWRSHEGVGARRRGGGGGTRGNGRYEKGGTFHREYGQLYSVPSGMGSGFGGGTSAATLLDAEDKLHGSEAEEASRKRIAAAQRERDLARKLGEMGRGVGAEYFRAQQHSHSSANESDVGRGSRKENFFERPSASALGLLANKAEHAHLSPAKDRKRHFGLGAVSTAGPEAVGWGNARKAGLLQPKESKIGGPEKGQTTLDADRSREPIAGIVRGRSQDGRGSGSTSPTKKRARFALEKGIREPGRESLGQRALDVQGREAKGEGEEDDELDIVYDEYAAQ